MKRLVKPLAAASLVLLSASCASPLVVTPRPGACPVCTGPEPTTPTLPPGEMLPARFPEVSPFVVTHATLTGADPHLRGGIGLEVALPLVRDGRARWLFSQALMGGAWGDQQHGAIISESATGVKVSLLPSFNLFDLYAVVTEGVLAGAGNIDPTTNNAALQWGNRLGGGGGLRLFRTFAIEISGYWVYALSNPFLVPTPSGSPLRHTSSVPDGALSFGVDLCAFGTLCDRAPLAQQTDDATCVVYTRAKAVCDAAGKDTSHATARKELCQNAVEALSIKAGAAPVLAREAFSTFLADLEKSEHATPRAGLVSGLSEKNRCLENWRSCGRRQECLLSQRGDSVATRRVYAPYAIEMLSALGCNAAGEVVGACDYTCEDPAPTAPVCP